MTSMPGPSSTVYLMYHELELPGRALCDPDPGYVRYVVSATDFADQMNWLKVAGWSGLSVEEALGRSRPHTVAITFDDGYEDNHSYALPILMRYAVPATFFITAGFVERDPDVMRRFHHFLSSRDDEVTPLDWAQVRELRSAGMAIGSHTYSHPNLARLSSVELDKELRVSKTVISTHLEENVDLFAYPFGKPKVHFTAETVSAVHAAGYRVAAAVMYRGLRASDSLLRIPRLFADGDTLDKLRAKVTGDYDLVSRWQEHAPEWLMRAISPDDFSR